MASRTLSTRMKAAAIAALMCLSVSATVVPITTDSTMNVQAAAVTVGETLAIGDTYEGNIKDLGVDEVSSITITVKAPYSGNISFGFGISTAEDPYWLEYDGENKTWVDTEGGDIEVPGTEFKVTADKNVEIVLDTSSIAVSPTGTFEFRNYYSADWSSGKEVKTTLDVVSVSAGGTSETTEATEATTKATEATDETEDTTKATEATEATTKATEATEATTKATEATEATTKATEATETPSAVSETIGEGDTFTGYWADYATSGIKNVAITFTADYTGSTSLGMGIGVEKSPYWYEWDGEKSAWIDTKEGTVNAAGQAVAVEEGGEYTIVYDVSKYALSYNPKDDKYPGHFEFRDYYGGEDGKGKLTITNVEVNTTKSSTVTEPEEPVDPQDEHKLSKTDGSTTANSTTGDGWKYDKSTGQLSATLARQQEFPDAPLTLTRGYDEEYYAGIGKHPEEGVDPLNSHKFSYTSFGMSGIGETVIVQSLLATITSTGTPIKNFMYGGGLNVQNESPADTESAKAKVGMAIDEHSGYWYNDMGEDRVDEYKEAGVEFGIEPTYGYFLTADEKNPLGEYFSVYWDVPTEVQQYEQAGDISFQYWYGVEDTEEYTEVDSVELIGGLITYTETQTIQDAQVVQKDINETIKAGAMSSEISYADLGMDSWNQVKAVVFTVSATSDLDKLVYGVGTSVADDFKTFGGDDWQYAMLNTKKGETEIVWFVPTGVTPNVEFGNVQFGYWYGADGSAKGLDSITLKSVSVYYAEGVEPTTETTTEPMKLMYGDVNCDENVDIMDVILLNKYLLGTGIVSEAGKINANVDLSDEIDATDSLNILKCVVELIEQTDFPL